VIRFVFAVLLVSLPLHAASLRGNVRSLFATDTKADDFEKYYESNTRLFAEGRVGDERMSATASAILRFSLLGPNDTKSYFDAELYEAYGRWARESVSIEGGMRVLRWGVMEYVSPTDTLNPHDFRQFTDAEVEDRYLPVPLVHLTVDRSPWVFEGVYQPFFRASRFDLIGTDTAFYRPSLAARMGAPYVDLQSNIVDSSERKLSDLVGVDPSDNPIHGEGGIRVGWSAHEVDAMVMYLNKRETLPAFVISSPATFNPTATPGTYPRNHLTGATLRWVTDTGITLKSEALYQSRSTFYDDTLAVVRKPLLRWALGADYDIAMTHFFTIEYAQDRIFDSVSRNYFATDKVQHIVSAAAIFNFDSEKYTIEVKGLGIPNQGSYLLNPRVLYKPFPQWEFGLGLQVWGGSNNSVFGLISENDQIFASAKYLF
jgi:hypothetical protein